MSNKSYNEFMKEMESYVKDFLDKEAPQLIAMFAYQGFCPKTMARDLMKMKVDKGINDEEFSNDVVQLLGAFHMHGPNINRITTVSSKRGQNIANIIKKYNIKSNKRNSSDVTLPRLSLVYSRLSWKVYDNIKCDIRRPVSAAEMGIDKSQDLSPNYVPCLLNYNDLQRDSFGLCLFIHILYQMQLSHKTQNPRNGIKQIAEFFEPAAKYALLAMKGSIATSDAKLSFANMVEELIDSLDTTQVSEAVNRIFKDLPSTVSCEEPTRFHKKINECIRECKPVSSIPIEFWKIEK